MRRTVHTLVRSKIFRRILIGFVVVAAILGVGLVVTDRQFEKLNERFEALLERDVKLVDDIQTLRRELAVLQGAKRGYLLTGDMDFLSRYEAARAGVISQLRRVEPETDERGDLGRFRRSFEQYIAISSEEIALRQRGDRASSPSPW